MLLGLHGLKGSGKDAAYGQLVIWSDAKGPWVVRDAFADRLKVSAARALGYERSEALCLSYCNYLKDHCRIFIEDEDGNLVDHLTGREFLQLYGTEAHRDVFAQDFWIKAVLPDTDDHVRYGRTDVHADELLVITDVRFPNEAAAIHAAGGRVYQIVRPGGDVDDHISERSLPSRMIDRVVLNTGTLDDLRNAICEAVTQDYLVTELAA